MIRSRSMPPPLGLSRAYALSACLAVAGCDEGGTPAASDAHTEASTREDADASGDATGDATEVGDVRDAGDAGLDVVGDAEPFATLAGEWTVSTWTLTRAVGSLFPMFPDGGTESAECARIVRDSYRATALQIRGADGSVNVNGRTCGASIAGDSVSIDCPCASSFQVCSHALRLRRDVSSVRLVGDESFVFSYSSPAYCRVAATLEATRSRGP